MPEGTRARLSRSRLPTRNSTVRGWTPVRSTQTDSATTTTAVDRAVAEQTAVTSTCAELVAPVTDTGRHRVPSDLADERCGWVGESLLGDSN